MTRGDEEPGGGWLRRREVGTRLGMRAVLWTARGLGRTPARFLVRQVALGWALVSPRIRAASRDYLRRVGVAEGRPRFRHVLRHLRTFAEVTLDRIFLLRGEFHRFEIARGGSEELRALAARPKGGRGALLVGAHFGSFEAMRAVAKDHDIVVNVVAYVDNARKINALLDALAVDRLRTRVITLRPGDPSAVLELRDLIDRGELVAMLGDRVGVGERTVRARLLGAEVRLPAGPWVLAAMLGCPVALVFGTYRPPRGYEVVLEPFSDRVELPRAGREAALEAVAQRFADRVELRLRDAPYNWFNFYPYWTDQPP